MKLITRDTDYAVRALIFIASHKKGLISAERLVHELRIPRPFLRKLLQILNREKFLISYKGRSGGFVLARPANRIFIIDLMRVFQGQVRLNECIFKKNICPNVRTCPLRSRICAIERRVLSQLKTITIASLLREAA